MYRVFKYCRRQTLSSLGVLLTFKPNVTHSTQNNRNPKEEMTWEQDVGEREEQEDQVRAFSCDFFPHLEKVLCTHG